MRVFRYRLSNPAPKPDRHTAPPSPLFAIQQPLFTAPTMPYISCSPFFFSFHSKFTVMYCYLFKKLQFIHQEPWRNGSALVFGRHWELPFATLFTKGCGFDPHGLRLVCFCMSFDFGKMCFGGDTLWAAHGRYVGFFLQHTLNTYIIRSGTG